MLDLLSIVVPCYNEENTLPLFRDELLRITKLMDDVGFEIIFVNDGSKDHTLKIIKSYSDQDKRMKYISFSRNFGKEAAIYAGLEVAKGDYVCTMDVDMQDPPYLLPKMYKAVSEDGYDSVATRRVTRKGEPPIRSFFAHCFYKLINKISNTEMVDGARDFRLMNRKFVNALLQCKEYNRFSKGLFGWVGFKNKWIEFENVERAAGESKWSFWSLFKYSIDGIVAFSTVPLVAASFVGLLFCVLAFIMIVVIVVRKICFDDPVAGWASIVCIIMMMSGIQFFILGIIGQYLAKAYLEIKGRPVYIIDECNITQTDSRESMNGR